MLLSVVLHVTGYTRTSHTRICLDFCGALLLPLSFILMFENVHFGQLICNITEVFSCKCLVRNIKAVIEIKHRKFFSLDFVSAILTINDIEVTISIQVPRLHGATVNSLLDNEHQ